MYNTLIFDLDGTLVDSLQDLACTMNQLLKEKGYQEHELDQYRYFVGNGVDKLIERALPEEEKQNAKKYRPHFDELYLENCLKHTQPYEGMKETIHSLVNKGIKLAVVTNKPKKHSVKIVEHLFPDCFLYVFGNTPYQPRKPHPCLTQLAMQLMDASKGNTLFIGDSNVDIETAKNAKLKSVGCTWGFRGEKELREAGADFIVNKPEEILNLL